LCTVGEVSIKCKCTADLQWLSVNCPITNIVRKLFSLYKYNISAAYIYLLELNYICNSTIHATIVCLNVGAVDFLFYFYWIIYIDLAKKEKTRSLPCLHHGSIKIRCIEYALIKLMLFTLLTLLLVEWTIKLLLFSIWKH
jgi:hypothetical protein